MTTHSGHRKKNHCSWYLFVITPFSSDSKVEEGLCGCHEVRWWHDRAGMRRAERGGDYKLYSLHSDGGMAKHECERTCYMERGKQK